MLVWYRIKEKLTRRFWSDSADADACVVGASLSSTAHCVATAIEALTLHMQLARVPSSSSSRLESASMPFGAT